MLQVTPEMASMTRKFQQVPYEKKQKQKQKSLLITQITLNERLERDSESGSQES